MDSWKAWVLGPFPRALRSLFPLVLGEARSEQVMHGLGFWHPAEQCSFPDSIVLEHCGLAPLLRIACQTS